MTMVRGRAKALAWTVLLALLPAGGHAQPADMTFTEDEAPEGPGRAPSETLVNALRAYQAERFAEAAVLLERVIEGGTGDDRGQVQRAQLLFGKCLVQMRLPTSALSVLAEIAQSGPEHPVRAAALPWLAQLARELPEPRAAIDLIGLYAPDDLARFDVPATRSLYAELQYWLGRARYDDGDLPGAIRALSLVPRTSPLYARAMLLLGTTHVRARRAGPAVRAFRSVLEAIDDGSATFDDEDRMADLAWLSLARVYYASRHYASAIEAWNRIDTDSESWPDALFERAWAYFLTGQYDRALGHLHTLGTPYLATSPIPEADVLSAFIQYDHCRYGAASSLTVRLQERWRPIDEEIAALEAQLAADEEATLTFATAVTSGAAGGGSARLRPLLRRSLADRTVGRAVAAVRALDDEAARFATMPREVRASVLGERVLQDVTVARSLAVANAAGLVRGRLARAREEVAEALRQSLAIQAEVTRRRREALVSGPRAAPPRPAVQLQADAEHVIWPFNGEVWRDELPYYRQPVRDRCTP